MYLIKNTKNNMYIKKQSLTIIDPNQITYTNDLLNAQVFEDSKYANANLKLIKQVLNAEYFTVFKPFKTYKEEAEYFEGNANPEVYKKWYQLDVNRYQKPSVTVDLIALRYNKEISKLQILLVQRKHWPFKDSWAMPGGFVDFEESIDHAVTRETKEETNVDLTKQLIIRMPAVSKPDRDPRMWVITNPNIVLFTPDDDTNAVAGDDAKNAKWFNVKLENDKLVLPVQLAFDHQDIITRALLNLKADFKYNRLPRVTTLLGTEITLNELKALFSVFDDKYKTIVNSNLARLYKKQLIKTDSKQTDNVGRPDNIYTYNLNSEIKSVKPKKKHVNQVDKLLNWNANIRK